MKEDCNLHAVSICASSVNSSGRSVCIMVKGCGSSKIRKVPVVEPDPNGRTDDHYELYRSQRGWCPISVHDGQGVKQCSRDQNEMKGHKNALGHSPSKTAPPSVGRS
jgi:hypothetical protein